MDISFQPKSQVPEESKPLVNVTEAVAGIKGLYIGEHKSIIAIIFSILPFLVGGAIIALIMINNSLQSQVDTLSGDLDKKDTEITKINKVPLKDIKQLSDRIQIVSQVLKNQAFSTSFLKILEYSVEDEVTFQKTTLESTKRSGDSNTLYTFTIKAVANSYAAVLNQIQTLQSSLPYKQFFSNVKMTNFDVDRKGVISFTITGNVSIKNLTPEEAELQLSGKTDANTSTDTGENATSSIITPQ